MNKLGYIPLDRRPIHLQQFLLFALVKGWKVSAPSPSWSGTIEKGMRQKKVLRWIEATPDLPKKWLVALDALLFGGLIQAREPTTTFHTAFQQLSEVLYILKQRRCSIFAFGFLPRLAPSVSCKEDIPKWKSVQKTLKKTSLSIFSSFVKWREQWYMLPSDLLETLYFVRRRNFFLLDAILESFVPSPIEHLLILQEDCAPGGLQKAEIAALKRKIRRLGLQENVHLHTGGDEAPYLLFARLSTPCPISAQYHFFPPHLALYPARYEDKPQAKVLKEKWRYLSFQKRDSAPALQIFTSRSQRDLLFAHPLRSSPRPVPASFVIDNLHCNGGSVEFLRAFFHAFPKEKFPLFFGWNTFANKVGMALATLKLCLSNPDPKYLKMFKMIRLMDDYIYQASLRQKLRTVCEQKGWDFWNYRTARGEVERWAEAQLQREWKMWQAIVPPLQGMPVPRIAFPFGRGFEAEIRV